MRKEEVWSVPIRRVTSFFETQADMTPDGEHRFTFGSCRITLEEAAPADTGIIAVSRTRLIMEGDDADATAAYRRFFLHFLSAGG